MEGAGGGIHELLGDGVGADPADLGVLSRFPVLGFAGPFVGGEDDGEEAVGGFPAQAPLLMWATFRDSGITVRPVSSYSSRTAVSVMGSPGSLLPTGRSHMPWANLAFWLRWRRTTRLMVSSWTMTAATRRVMDSRPC
ncbi:hypothetical protein AQJ46_00990 [Streptomyces canus]|uniref:Uncharacterized protein n=1 Tax=Streptomyces canus TaxID=58343 RepID=A0A101SIF0_9ACTN|nr:hypothetical protein AQJ46_00990 [Streptomyces canus]